MVRGITFYSYLFLISDGVLKGGRSARPQVECRRRWKAPVGILVCEAADRVLLIALYPLQNKMVSIDTNIYNGLDLMKHINVFNVRVLLTSGIYNVIKFTMNEMNNP